MTIYLVNIVATAILSSIIQSEYDENGIETYQSKRKKRICLFLIFAIWVSIYTFRGVTGFDSAVYRVQYQSLFSGQKTVSEVGVTLRSTVFAYLLSWCASFSNGSWIFFCFISGVLIYLPIIILIYKKSEDVNLSCLLYIFTLSYYFGFNGIRQAIAGSFAMLGYYVFLREKKLVKYAIIVLLAYLFHSGALLAVPFQLLSLKKLKSVSTWVILTPFFAASFFLKDIWGTVVGAFNGVTVVTNYDDIFLDPHGSSIVRVAVWLIPIVLAFVYYTPIKEKYQDIDSDILMIICGTIFMIYSLADSNFSQMSMFFIDANIIIFPKIYSGFQEKNKRLLRYIVLLVYFSYMIILLLNGDGHFYPYKSVWESGMF